MRLPRRLVSVLVFLSLGGVFVVLWFLFRTAEQDQLRRITAQYADEGQRRIQWLLRNRFDLLRSFQSSFAKLPSFDPDDFLHRAEMVYQAAPGFQAINWIDPTGRIQIVFPREGNLPALGRDLHSHPDAAEIFQVAEREKRPTITPPVRLFQGGLGFASYWPVITDDGELLGYVNGVFRLRRVLDVALGGIPAPPGLGFRVLDGNTVLYDTEPQRAEVAFVEKRSVDVGGNHWVLEVGPSTRLARSFSGQRGLPMLAGGLVFALALALLVEVLDRRRQQHREAQARAEEAEKALRGILEASPYRVFAVDESGRIVFDSPAVEALTGYTPEETHGTRIGIEEAVDPEDVPILREGFQAALRGERAETGPVRVIRKDGQIRRVRVVWAPLVSAEGYPARAIGVMVDCTAEVEAQEQLRRSEKRYRTLLETLPAAVLVVNRAGDIVVANRTAKVWTGLSEDKLHGWNLAQFLEPADLEVMRERMSRLFAEGKVEGTWRYRVRLPSGEGRWVESASVRLDEDDAEPLALVIVWDVTEQERSRSELELSQQRFKALFDNVPEAIFVFDAQTYRILDVNRVATERYGYTKEEFVRMTILDIRPQQEVTVIKRLLSGAQPGEPGLLPGEYWHRRKDGSVFPVAIYRQVLDLEGQRIVIAVAVDLTERKRSEEEKRRLQQQLLQAQKLEAIGTLAGGVAHDFNNILTGIIGLADLIMLDSPSDSSLYRDAQEIKKAANRAATLVRQLLAFSRRQLMQPQRVSLNDVVLDMSRMLRRLIGEDVELKQVLAENLPPVKADPGQIEQVIANLAVNARDAMPEGGELLLETSLVVLDSHYCETHPWARPGKYVLLTVSDTGVGMDPTVRERIFEPFFTTKERGQGTGLGLSVVYGIVKQHDGLIHVYSEPGRGTTFRIYLPALEGESEPLHHTESVPRVIQGSETVLVVEDEEIVRALAVRALERAGYRVLEAGNGEEALEVLSRRRGEVGLVFADVVMPVMGGRELYDRVREMYPDLPFLFASGYSLNGVHQRFVLEEGLDFIAKPYDPEQLLLRVRDLLDRVAGDKTA